MPATFFVCGHDAKRYRAVISSIGAAGHEIAAHGHQHASWDFGELLEKTPTAS
jgi:peptidoglycan/xylan/chitin deacetylase (PgdA/CDA1 family)